MAANCALYPHNWAVWGGFNKINKLTGRPPPAPEARGGQSLTKDQFVIAQPMPRADLFRNRNGRLRDLARAISSQEGCHVLVADLFNG